MAFSFRCALVAASLLVCGRASAEHVRFYNLEGFGTWLDGNPETTTITEDGAITLGPTTRERYEDSAATFSAAAALGDEVLVARIDDGQVLAIDRAGETREIFKPEESVVTALLVRAGAIYVAVGPPAKLYKVDARGKSEEFYTADAEYIWALAAGEGDVIYAATGAPAAVVSIDGKGNGAQIFEVEETHLRSITWDRGLGLFAGGGERGIVYRSNDGKKDFRALYDSGHVEITRVVVAEGSAFVSAVSGAQALISEEGNEQRGSKSKGPEVRSQLVRLDMDGTAEVLAGSSDEAIFDMAVDDKGRIVVATGATGREDPRGRLYTVEPSRRQIAMIYQSPSRRITHLVSLPRQALAAVAAAGGRVIHLTGGYARSGEFFTTPFDAVINSQFGIVEVFGSWPQGTRVTAALRSGQTSEPDDTWSPWSAEIEAPGRRSANLPAGRYLQARLTLHSDGQGTPSVHRLRVAYLRQNLRPFVREVVSLRKGVALLPIVREEQKTKTINLGDKAGEDAQRNDDKERKKKSSSPRARQVEQRGALTVKWVAEDPNGDELLYDLMMRGNGESDWRPVDSELEDPFYTLQAGQLPDGHYQFRVRATDAPSNPNGMEQSDVRESRSVLVDNTPPQLDPLDVQVSAGRVTVRAVVADGVGPITEAEYSVDGQDFRPVSPDDGVLDGPGESFTIRLGALPRGPHTITLRVADEGDNEGFGEARFTVP